MCCFGVWITYVSNSLRLLWSVRMVKRCPSKYWRHFFTVAVIRNSSLTYVDVCKSFGLKGLLKKAMGWPCCDRTAPIPTLEASVSIMKGNWKSGKPKTRASERACLSCSKVTCVWSVHWNGSVVVALTRGVAIVAYPLIKRLQKPTRPKKLCRFFF